MKTAVGLIIDLFCTLGVWALLTAPLVILLILLVVVELKSTNSNNPWEDLR